MQEQLPLLSVEDTWGEQKTSVVEEAGRTEKGSSPRRERRQCRRSPLRSSVRVECRKGSHGLGPNLNVAAVDLSEAGLGLVVKAALEHGQEVEVLLMGAGLTRPLKRLASVAWSFPLESCCWRVGLTFERRLTFFEVQRFTRPVN
jgi:hypothetical protein